MKMSFAVAAFSAAISATGVTAQPPPPSDLTRQQVRDRADELFDRFDLNHDGHVTRSEARVLGRRLLLLRAATGRDVAPGIGGHTLRFLEHRFAGRQEVTKPQFEAAFLAHFDDMDVNHDGILTAAERQEAH
jgi:hypothetical protein